MPKVSGFDVLDILRNTPETANVKIIMLTALEDRDVMIRGLLREYGLNPNADVTLVPLGASGTGFVAALQRGDLDGFVYTAPWPEVAETQGLGKVIINMYAGEYPALDGIYFNTLYGSKAFGSTGTASISTS